MCTIADTRQFSTPRCCCSRHRRAIADRREQYRIASPVDTRARGHASASTQLDQATSGTKRRITNSNSTDAGLPSSGRRRGRSFQLEPQHSPLISTQCRDWKSEVYSCSEVCKAGWRRQSPQSQHSTSHSLWQSTEYLVIVFNSVLFIMT